MPATVELARIKDRPYKPVTVAHTLMKRYVAGKDALDAVEALTLRDYAVVRIPTLESLVTFGAEMADAGVAACDHAPLGQVDVKDIRKRVELTQEQFALHFGLDVKTVRNWEQGVSQPDATGRSLLTMILRNPDLVRAALNAPIDDGAPSR